MRPLDLLAHRVPNFVITVITAEAGSIHLGYGVHLPRGRKRLQRLASRDLTVFGKNAAHNL